MARSIFLSHNLKDKPFARRLAADLSRLGVPVWIDEAEIHVGDSLIEKIRSGIDASDFVAVILSPDSVQSSWVRHEIDVAMNQEIDGKRVKVLPIMYRKCEVPGFLTGKLYADFSDESLYASSLAIMLRRLEVDELHLVQHATCEWSQVVMPTARCFESTIHGTSFCARHLTALAARAVEAMKNGGHYPQDVDSVRMFMVAVLGAAGATATELLIQHWDFIWSRIEGVWMFPPAFRWTDTDDANRTYLGRLSRTEGPPGYGLERSELGRIVEEILRRVPISAA